jgi:hypothetical protein
VERRARPRPISASRLGAALARSFWLDTSDPHRLRSAIQILTRTHLPLYMGVQDHERQSGLIWQNVWGNARIKQILSE